ncbi:MAG: DNA alkylation repair protein [Muribaculaceae bacterium]|nr:DNA alkylation repair protein [Muribaculaceae bacterium]
MLSMRDDAQRQVLMRFFRTAPGQYGEGDEFLGIKVPQTRALVKSIRGEVSPEEIEHLLYSKWHEVRLCGFLLLVDEMKALLPRRREPVSERHAARRTIVDFYLKHARQANNWDLVDLSCEYIVGEYLLYSPADETDILHRLADSDNLWEQRIAIVSTLTLIRHNIFAPTLEIIEKLKSHPHDLIHKAMGWMLREIGKRDEYTLTAYLEANYRQLPRTTLRYAIERFPAPVRHSWLTRK